MKLRHLVFVSFVAFFTAYAGAVQAQAKVKRAETCGEFLELSRAQIAAGYAKMEAFDECLEFSGDPPIEFRQYSGAGIVATQTGRTLKTSPCRPTVEKRCPNSLREDSQEPSNIKGYSAKDNPNLNVQELPWGDMKAQKLPCGAIAGLAAGQLEKMLGKATVKTPEIKQLDELNSGLRELRSLITRASNHQNMPQGEIDKTINELSGKISAITSKIPVVGAVVKGQLNRQVNSLKGKLGDLSKVQNNTPLGQLNTLKADANNEIGNLLSLLNKAQGFLKKVTGQYDGALDEMKKNINDSLSGLLGNFFKHRNCEDGKFWGILNNALTLVMGRGTYNYDIHNNTFITPNSALVTLPKGSSIVFNIGQQGAPEPFILPNGASFRDINNHRITIPPGTAARVRSDGIVASSRGDQYRIGRNQDVELDPNGVIGFWPGKEVPISDANAKVYPMGAANEYPSYWGKQRLNWRYD